MSRRFPLVSVLIASTPVQGVEAPPQIVRALQWLDGRDDVDAILLVRGGGSIEDLWAFNDERVARAIFAAGHPIIAGVGHETDFTMADFVADLRAPTPSAAAELATPDAETIRSTLATLQSRLTASALDRIEQAQWQVQTLTKTLRHLSPRQQVENNRQRLDNLAARLDQLMQRQLERAHNRLAVAQAGLTAVNPLSTLARGYAIVRTEDGRIIRSAQQVTAGDSLAVQVADGQFNVSVTEMS